ncbi:MAG: thiamine phosphate synthase [Candidatus Dormibacteraeota bacterium]|uniref:Thiamine phosphate synthase n=2 Tax=Candidatus Dormiibacter inghamiae TaxID=3127013 RepID=A0A934NBN7_9BACT|nr:thiamine phosphate synthase [Candidatus Dormibacteraeota bacterium]MBJ7605689.1 thiamine phosphate synthase [Candidatus Dormibacteraeota bacterium]
MLLLRAPELSMRQVEMELRRLVDASPVPVLAHSRCDVALAVGAAGVQLPEVDIPTVDARTLLGPDRLLGRSVHSLAAAKRAESEGADYVVYGPVFPTASHPGRAAVGLGALRDVCLDLRIPVLAIGGVDDMRSQECLAAGAQGFAAIGYFQRR